MRRESSAVLAKIHRQDFTKPAEPGGSSFYMKELTEKLLFIKTEIISRYSLGDFGRTWCVFLCNTKAELTWRVAVG